MYFSAQGAAQAIEDAAVLGELFARIQDKAQIKDVVRMYEMIRKPRTARVITGSEKRRNKYQLCDGTTQQDRDQKLLETEPSDRFPECIEDPVFQSWLLEYDVGSEVEMVWQKYQVQNSSRVVD